ncbi:hypothetical protein IAT38_001776 [Cryptococcus sp. DSM 104549]
MVLINDKKFACERCIKGHRVSTCTHTDRPLYEVKKKGRPATQCKHCKEKRKTTGSSVHTKCKCGSADPKACDVTLPPNVVSALASSNAEAGPSGTSGTTSSEDKEVETRKGQPGSKATFPNGLRDVHEMAEAASSLAGLGDDDGVVKAAERTVQALLNPCKCELGGPCTCCEPKKRDKKGASPGATAEGSLAAGSVASASPSEGGCCSSSAPNSSTLVTSRPHPPAITVNPHLSPDNMYHPAHTSPFVHKTRLFSPYTAGPSQTRHGRRETTPSSARSPGWASPRSLRPPPSHLKPLTDMRRLISAAVNVDGTLVSQLPRSALGLPGIESFDAAAESSGSIAQPMELEDPDRPLAFPTAEEVVIGACMCGDQCACPGCATHDTSTPPPGGHVHDGHCGEGCKGHHNCGNSTSIPSGVTSIAQLICLAASNVPRPPPRSASLDPHDTRVLPRTAQLNEDAGRAMGFVQLKPLECCGGKCQCPPGQCSCQKECCGCCGKCECEEEPPIEGDEDTRMDEGCKNPGKVGSCCSGKREKAERQGSGVSGGQVAAQVQVVPGLEAPQLTPEIAPVAAKSCCSGGKKDTPSAQSSGNVSPSDAFLAHNPAFPPSIETTLPSTSGSRQDSPLPPSRSSTLRRSGSSATHPDRSPASSRRGTVSQPSASSASTRPSKATAPYPPAAQHNRTIMPRRSVTDIGAGPSGASGSTSVPHESRAGSPGMSGVSRSSSSAAMRGSQSHSLPAASTSRRPSYNPSPQPPPLHQLPQPSQSHPAAEPAIQPLPELGIQNADEIDPGFNGPNPDLMAFLAQWSMNQNAQQGQMDSAGPVNASPVNTEQWLAAAGLSGASGDGGAVAPGQMMGTLAGAAEDAGYGAFDLEQFLQSLGQQPLPQVVNSMPEQPASQPPPQPQRLPDAQGPPEPRDLSDHSTFLGYDYPTFFLNSGRFGSVSHPQASAGSTQHIPVARAESSGQLTPSDDYTRSVGALPQFTSMPGMGEQRYGGVGGVEGAGSGMEMRTERVGESMEQLRDNVERPGAGFAGIPGVGGFGELPGGVGGGSGGNMIDLSKPLDAGALARIMKALEQQQRQQHQQQMASSNPPASAPLPQQHHVPSQYPPPQPPLPPPMVPAPQQSQGSRMAPYAAPSKDLDDMFNEFVTLDGQPQGAEVSGAQVGEQGRAKQPWEQLGFGVAELSWDQPRLWSN